MDLLDRGRLDDDLLTRDVLDAGRHLGDPVDWPGWLRNALSASFSTWWGAGFCRMLVSKPPPWIMKFPITRWKIVPV